MGQTGIYLYTRSNLWAGGWGGADRVGGCDPVVICSHPQERYLPYECDTYIADALSHDVAPQRNSLALASLCASPDQTVALVVGPLEQDTVCRTAAAAAAAAAALL
jgi:hypothetical protein